jgi:hypothetical protein
MHSSVITSQEIFEETPNNTVFEDFFREYRFKSMLVSGRDSEVVIATRYGLGGPGVVSLRGRGFPHPARNPLEPT